MDNYSNNDFQKWAKRILLHQIEKMDFWINSLQFSHQVNDMFFPFFDDT